VTPAILSTMNKKNHKAPKNAFGRIQAKRNGAIKSTSRKKDDTPPPVTSHIPWSPRKVA